MFNKEVQDVMDLLLKKTGFRLKEAYTKKILKENKEATLNTNFHKIAGALIQVRLSVGLVILPEVTLFSISLD